VCSVLGGIAAAGAVLLLGTVAWTYRQGTDRLLETSRREGVRRILYGAVSLVLVCVVLLAVFHC